MHVLTFEQALATVQEHAASLPRPAAEAVPLLSAQSRVLAQDLRADRDQPPFDRSTRDGFAVRAAEWTSGKPLRLVGQVRAGELWTRELPPSSAIEIMTGAPVPRGADAVAMVEHAVEEGGFVRRSAEQRPLAPAENIIARGSEAHAGDVIVGSGTLLTAAEIALAAACGCSELHVSRRPRVAILATGDELVELTRQPATHQIRNSNTYALSALVHAAGGDPHPLPIARDTRDDLRERIRAASGCDLLLLSGGVSAGKYDLVEEVLAGFGAEFLFTGVTMQPGRPVVFGRMPAANAGHFRYFFGLPGNPVSTEVTFRCFAAPLLHAVSGAAFSGPKFAQATSLEDIPSRSGLTRILPACLTPDLRRPAVRLVPWRSSGDLAANARANCYAVLPDGQTAHSGDVVTVLLR